MAGLISLPLELVTEILSYLDLEDLLRVCSTCRYLHDTFRSDCLMVIVEDLPLNSPRLKNAIEKSSHLILCHALLHAFDTYGVDAEQGPLCYDKLFKREASFKHIPVGEVLQELFLENGPWADETQFLLAHGASLHDVPRGISSLLAYTVFNYDSDEHTVELSLEFLISHGASFRTMPFVYETFIDDLAGQHHGRLLIALRYGGPLQYVPPALHYQLTETYTLSGFCEVVEALLINVPNGLKILLVDQAQKYGICTRLDDLIERGASFEGLQLNDVHKGLHEEYSDHRAAAMKAVINGGADLWTVDDLGNHPLYYLAGGGYVGLTRDAIRRGSPIDFRNNYGWTALHHAASQGRHRVLEALLQAGAESSIANDRGESAIVSAVLQDHVDAVRVLVEGRVDLNIPDKKGMTPIFHAIVGGNMKLIQLLLAGGVDQTITYNGWTPVYAAAYCGHYEAIEMFIRSGADPTLPMVSSALTPLHMAVWEGHLNCVQLLHAHGADLELSSKDGTTALHNAAQQGHLEIVRWLEQKGLDLDVRNGDGESPLHLAAGAGHLDTVKDLIQHGASSVVCDHHGNTALHHACDADENSIIKYLIDGGADVNLINRVGMGPLSITASNGNVEAIELLLAKGAEPNPKGQPPLYPAVHSQNAAAIAILLAAHAAIECLTSKGVSALELASLQGQPEIVQLLLEAGGESDGLAEIKATALHAAAERGHEEVTKLLLQHGASLSIKDKHGMNAIHLAAKHGWPVLVSLLLEHGSEVDSTTVDGRTPLHIAAGWGRVDAARVLVDRGARFQATDKANSTPLHFAAEHNHLEVVKLLSEAIEDPLTLDLFARTPLHLAVTRGHWDVAEYLDQFHSDPHLRDGYGRTVLDWVAMDTAAAEHFTKQRSYKQGSARDFDTDVVRRSICYLSKRLRDSGSRHTVIGFRELGHCMILLGNFDDATICFQNLISKVNDRNGKLYHGYYCAFCSEDADNPTGIFHVCMVCVDFSVCEKCVRREVLHVNRPVCHNHAYLEINEPPEVLGKKIPKKVRQWLKRLIIGYDTTTD